MSASRSLHALRVLLAGAAFAGFGLGAPFVGLSLPLFWLLGGTKLERRQRCQRIVAGTFRFFHAYMRLVGLVHYRPQLQLPSHSGPRVIVANHPTLVDVTAVLSAHPEACCLVKSTIYNNPLFFLIMKFCGHIKVDRHDRQAGPRAIEEATARIDDGSDVLLFPEGTRSPVGAIGPFRAGAFAVAVHCEIPVAPVAIFCSQPVLKRGTPWYLIPPEPVTLELKSLGHFMAEENETIQSLSDRVQQTIRSSLHQPA